MLKLTLIQMRVHFRRTLAVVIAIVLGVAFFSSAMMSGSVIENAIRNTVGNQSRGADIIVTSETGAVDPGLVDDITGVQGVRETEALLTAYGDASMGGARVFLRLGPLSGMPEIIENMPLKAGRLPAATGEIALTEGAISSTGVEIGDSISWSPFAGDDTRVIPFTVVGVISGGNAFGTNLTEAFVPAAQFASIVQTPNVNGVIVQVADDAMLERVRQDIGAVLPENVSALTFDEVVDAEVARLDQGSNALVYGLVAFALIALFVGGIVISNTFSITIAQRTGELAMFRCIGAEKKQIHRSMMIESTILGILSSATGVVAGFVIVNLVAGLFVGSADRVGLSDIPLTAWVFPFIAGVLVTLLSALAPARGATAVHPLQALRQSDAPVVSTQASLRRAALALVLILGGGGLMLGGMLRSLSMEDESPFGPLLIGMAGGALSFVGLMLASIFTVPYLVAGLGKVVCRVFGPPADIATANATRNPNRIAATSSALMMGVTLIAMMTVGAATVKATWTDVIDDQSPVDLVVSQGDDDSAMALPEPVMNRLETLDAIRHLAPVQSHMMELRPEGQGSGSEISVVGIDPDDARSIARSSKIFDGFAPGIIVIPEDIAKNDGLETGDQISLTGERGQSTFSVKVVDLASWDVYIAPDDFSSLSADVPVSAVWLRLDDNASVKDVVRDISDSVPEGMSVLIEGSANERATYLELVDQMLLITTALLGVAVIIAIVGVGNTLTLSVLERARESGMLRAMGLTAGQLRGTLAIEGVMISVVGGLIGLVAGTIYGWVGAITLFGPSWTVTPGFPGPRLALILAVTVMAGLLASVIPGRRASMVSPVQALASV